MLMAGSYHGSHNVSIVGFRGAAAARRGGVPEGTVADTVIARFNDLTSVEEAFAAHGSSLAAVIVEPQQRSLDPTPEFLPALRRLCSSHGAILIFDEVLTGFRLAFGGAQEYYGVEPDLVCYGKIVGGGFPLSAVCGRREIMDLTDPARPADESFVHVSGTLSGNPVSAVAGLATLSELQRPGAYERLHALGRRLRAGLEAQLRRLGITAAVTGSGPIAALRFSDAPARDRALKTALTREMILRGVFVQLATRFYVSLAHGEEEVDAAVETFGQALPAAVASV
jgi:glutamate-1-semialdehyde 2,1-aminomutase